MQKNMEMTLEDKTTAMNIVTLRSYDNISWQTLP
jgi:hypothetical protein